MSSKQCARCSERAALRRPKTFEQLCKSCFFSCLEDEVHDTITRHALFAPGERVAIAASGGKDSTVLAHLLTLLNARHNYGLDLFLLSIDEGISGYRDDSLETVKRNEATYGIPLKVLSYRELYGWSMDEIVAQIGTKNNCTFCGVFRRQALDRGGVLERADKIATGHNADDIAETVLLNLMRGDVPRLSRCTSITTGGEGGPLPRVKPFKYTYEKEIVMYAYYKRLDYFSTECLYAPYAARGAARDLVKDLEAARPSAIMDLIHSAESWRVAHVAREAMPTPKNCERCGFMSSQAVCKACVLLEGLNSGLPNMGVTRTRRGQQQQQGRRQPIQLQMEDGEQQQQQPQQGQEPGQKQHEQQDKPAQQQQQQQQQQGTKGQQQAQQGPKQQQGQQRKAQRRQRQPRPEGAAPQGQAGEEGQQQQDKPLNRKARRLLMRQQQEQEQLQQQQQQQERQDTAPPSDASRQPDGSQQQEALQVQEPIVVTQQQPQQPQQQLGDEAAASGANQEQQVQAAEQGLQRLQLADGAAGSPAAPQPQEVR